MKMKPSEYFRQNCFITPSSIHRCEVEMRHDIGLEQMLFGTDYPQSRVHLARHPRSGSGSPSPVYPENEVRAILGENAIRCYGNWTAPSCWRSDTGRASGPVPTEVFGSHDVDPELVEKFDRRAGISRGRSRPTPRRCSSSSTRTSPWSEPRGADGPDRGSAVRPTSRDTSPSSPAPAGASASTSLTSSPPRRRRGAHGQEHQGPRHRVFEGTVEETAEKVEAMGVGALAVRGDVSQRKPTSKRRTRRP